MELLRASDWVRARPAPPARQHASPAPLARPPAPLRARRRAAGRLAASRAAATSARRAAPTPRTHRHALPPLSPGAPDAGHQRSGREDHRAQGPLPDSQPEPRAHVQPQGAAAEQGGDRQQCGAGGAGQALRRAGHALGRPLPSPLGRAAACPLCLRPPAPLRPPPCPCLPPITSSYSSSCSSSLLLQVNSLLERASDVGAILEVLPELMEPRNVMSVLVTVEKWCAPRRPPLLRAACDWPLPPREPRRRPGGLLPAGAAGSGAGGAPARRLRQLGCAAGAAAQQGQRGSSSSHDRHWGPPVLQVSRQEGSGGGGQLAGASLRAGCCLRCACCARGRSRWAAASAGWVHRAPGWRRCRAARKRRRVQARRLSAAWAAAAGGAGARAAPPPPPQQPAAGSRCVAQRPRHRRPRPPARPRPGAGHQPADHTGGPGE
jgi:hypothetical protein